MLSGSVNLKCDLSHPANLSANCLGFIANPSGNHAATRHFSLEKEALYLFETIPVALSGLSNVAAKLRRILCLSIQAHIC